jgi:hypothetical protein
VLQFAPNNTMYSNLWGLTDLNILLWKFFFSQYYQHILNGNQAIKKHVISYQKLSLVMVGHSFEFHHYDLLFLPPLEIQNAYSF